MSRRCCLQDARIKSRPPLSAHQNRHLDSTKQKAEQLWTLHSTYNSCGSRTSSRFDQTGTEESRLAMEDVEEPVSRTPRVPDQAARALDSQASHLCQACLSALTMHDLEGGRTYPHHSSLRSFLDACQRRCYICSPFLLDIPEEYHRILQLLAEGKLPEPTDESNSISTDEDFPSAIGYRRWKSSIRKDELVSLSGLRIERRPGNIMEIVLCLNPDYDEALPAGIKLYEAHPRVWSSVSDTIWFHHGPVIITDKGSSGPFNWLLPRPYKAACY